MIAIPHRRTGPKLSQYLPEPIEKELRTLVFDGIESNVGGKAPQIIIGNAQSGCHATFFSDPDGTEFIFHHCKMQYATECKCMVQASVGEMTYQIPQDLDEYRLRLIYGKDVPFKLEPKLAAIVAMKIFLGMSVPEPLKMKVLAEDIALTTGKDKQEGGTSAGD